MTFHLDSRFLLAEEYNTDKDRHVGTTSVETEGVRPSSKETDT